MKCRIFFSLLIIIKGLHSFLFLRLSQVFPVEWYSLRSFLFLFYFITQARFQCVAFSCSFFFSLVTTFFLRSNVWFCFSSSYNCYGGFFFP
jgi:hypothetical protein